jgi:ribosomal protein S18 acetylase RimI-like enzyme
MTSPLIIRPATPTDRLELRWAVVELQNYERMRHATRRPGEEIADACLDWMQRQAEASGAVLVAEIGREFVGFVAGWIDEATNIAETPDSNRFGYISGICVMPGVRGQRIAERLLDGIEQYLRPAGITRLRISSLAVNTSARTSYERAGFLPYEVLYEKAIDGEGDA